MRFLMHCLLLSILVSMTAPSFAQSSVARQADALFRQMKEQIPISENAYARQIVECVAFSIIDQLDNQYRHLPWEVVLFEQPSVNAFAMPGGKIGVNIGIFQVARNQHQLAGVIGHEIAHVTSQHAEKRASHKAVTSTAVGVLSALLGDGGLSSALASSALRMGAELGLNRPYDRQQETEADALGMGYIARAGFDPRETIALWKHMGELQRQAPPEFMSTHPSDETRMDTLISGLTPALIRANQAHQAGLIPHCQ
jgi:predicted Zn-dependent protease